MLLANPRSVFTSIKTAEAITAVELKVEAEAEAMEAAEVLEALNDAAKLDTEPTDLWHVFSYLISRITCQ
jgi:hypothetical protein